MGISQKNIEQALKRTMAKLPTQSPAPENIAASKNLRDFLKRAKGVEDEQGDKFMAVDHMLISLFDEK